jgi:hypothetical protein
MLDDPSKQRLQILVHAAQNRDLVLNENRLLLEKSNESSCRQSTRSTASRKAKGTSYKDDLEAQASVMRKSFRDKREV